MTERAVGSVGDGGGKEGGGVEGETIGEEGTCTPPTGPADVEKEVGLRDALGRFLPGHCLLGEGRPPGSKKARLDDMLDEYGPVHLENLVKAASGDDERDKREAQRDITKLVGRRVADRISEERALTPASERRLVELLSSLPTQDVREAINVGMVEALPTGEDGEGEGRKTGVFEGVEVGRGPEDEPEGQGEEPGEQ